MFGLALVFAMTALIICIPVFFATKENMFQNVLKEPKTEHLKKAA